MVIRVVVSGPGKMGLQVLQALTGETDLQPVGVLSRSPEASSFTLGDVSLPCRTEPLELFRELQPDVVVDFSNAERTSAIVEAAVAMGVRPVIGTSGLSSEFLEKLRVQCEQRQLGAVFAPNFAVGAVLMIYLARQAAKYFEAAEIIEMHHDQKADAPSATSVATAEAMVKARGRPFKRNEPQKETLEGTRRGSLEGVTIHSVRLPGLVAHQEVILGGQGQTLTIRHDSLSRESFMPGVMLAIREVMKLKGLVVGLEPLLGLD
ncbi:MAG TPA: 4-hydroxy-tetrahydrodipicolinate reductase [Dehalococcoidia bacterium]|nr:4-hydroxy-tetrahydrodipicolinate reductase [Dehalococcoidia bacterium]